MYFSKAIAITVLAFAASAAAAPTTADADIAAPFDAREAEPEANQTPAFDVGVEDDFPWGVAEEDKSEVSAREAGASLEARGFGCGFTNRNRYECNKHCRSLKGGRTGGYCGGFLWHTCICVFG
ncbi:hypothetical protein BU23DRAFT_603697 [Bimuria novae-zelandiae CBS 107.79]|uniref:Invertebrate defensins family profile domain-containing protein n=1 Tax=Bimuria novae-zelandiae CBS 107.79 TaxID=1447943 RepID=A0A6A5UNM2_9PLEO|nr:hypothetical protein BU23DRAFT_603697 [Bimuria novae-zelandiae CBS 107.79]